MTRQVGLLRGINVGARNRVAMAQLRELMEALGYTGVETLLQSGNVVFGSKEPAATSERRIAKRLHDETGLDIKVLVRTRAELAAVVKRNPLGKVATEPKRYQVSFLEKKLPAKTLKELEAVAAPSERVAAHGRELYAWHPAGVARSKLWAKLAGKGLGVTATARNWTTVEALLELADG